MKNIFITGGAGYIGSHCVISLAQNGYNPIILDNFSNSHKSIIKKIEKIINKRVIYYKVDLRNKKKLRFIFKKHSCFCVIHCAGSKAVEESIKKPLHYFDNNVTSTLSLLECMKESRVFKIIFSSSATVYDDSQPLPWKENSPIGITKNPYGTSKFIIERILMDLAKSETEWCIRIARYFNPISNHSSGLIRENPKGIPNNLVPFIVKVSQKKMPFLKVFGKNYNTKDGTCIRDFIHVMDLAEGHVAIIKNIVNRAGLKIYNFGTGKGQSIMDVIKTFQNNTGKSLPYRFVRKRKGDAAESYCDPKKAYRELNWKTKYDLNKSMVDIKKTL